MANALAVFKGELEAQRSKFANVLPRHLSPERLVQTAVGFCGANPYILEKCDRGSVFRSVYTAAIFGLEIDNRQSAIVPYGSKAQLIPMVSGLVTLAYNAGYKLTGTVVRQNDSFDYSIEPPMIHHKPPAAGSDAAEARGDKNPIIAAYAVARRLDDPPNMPPLFEVMNMVDIERIRDNSSGYKAAKKFGRSTPWETDFAAMCRKTPIRSLANHLPWQVQKAVELETIHERGFSTWANRDDAGQVDIEKEAIEGELV
jgi:recombination protein RecT